MLRRSLRLAAVGGTAAAVYAYYQRSVLPSRVILSMDLSATDVSLEKAEPLAAAALRLLHKKQNYSRRRRFAPSS